MGRPGEVKGRPVVVPNRIGTAFLHAVQSAYQATRTGMVVVAIARVP
jgi:hypothetical protein